MELSSEVTDTIAEGHSEAGLQVPITYIFLPENTMEKSVKACGVCLQTDCRLYSLEQCNLKEIFKQLTGLQSLNDKCPSSLCAECATFLIKCKRFREKSLTVQKMLSILSNTTRTVTINELKQLRKRKKLFSNLSVKRNCPNYYDTVYVSDDYEEKSLTNLKGEQTYTEFTRDCEENRLKLSSNLLVKQNPPYNLDTDMYVCDDDIEEEEMLTSVKDEKIKTELTIDSEANLTTRDYIELSSNSSETQNPPNNFDTDIYVCENNKEGIPVSINSKQIKTELRSDCKKNVVNENPPDSSDIPYFTFTYENYEENTITTVKDNLLFSDSDENYIVKTETNVQQEEVNLSKNSYKKNPKMEIKKAGDGKKPATNTGKNYVPKKVYNCEQCEKVLKSKAVYLDHLRIEHHSNQHVCRLCGLSFINKRCLREHKRFKHEIDNSHIPDDGPCCPECSLRFLSEKALQMHLQGPVSVKQNDGEDKVKKYKVKKKVSIKRIKKSVPTRKSRPKKIPLDKKILILNNMIVVKRMTLEEQLEVVQKRKDNNQNKPYKCDICYFGSNLKKTLETHMMRHSKEMGELSCNLCHVRFKTRIAYCKHKLNHATLYSCVECTFTTYMRHIASKHVFQFHEKQKYTCDKCGVEYTSINTLYQHKKMKHPSSQHVCRLCGYSFVNKMGMKTHHNAKHLLESIEMPTVVDGPSCAECSLRFMNEKALQTHMRVSHTTGTGKKMVNSAQYYAEYHYVPDRKVVCETCGKLVLVRYLKFHLEEHAGKTFPCPICGKVYRTKTGMYQHKYQSHNKAKNAANKDKRIQCKVCKKMISSAGNLSRHMKRAHSGNIFRVNCSYCDKKFPLGDDLNQHVNHVHLKKPWYRKRAR